MCITGEIYVKSFKLSFISCAHEQPVPAVSRLLSAVRQAPAWDDVAIFPEGGVFPRMHLSWKEADGFNIHYFADETSSGEFLTDDAEISYPEVEINLGGQALELWPKQLFITQAHAARAVEFFLESGKRLPAQRWVETGGFPRQVIWEGREQREAWEHARRRAYDSRRQ
tara:strand:- start:2605 stop:3111 length:507 start_codon:yes stop_codon:yes gene_type:complete